MSEELVRLGHMDKKQDEISADVKEIKVLLTDANTGLVVRITRLEVHHKVFIGIISLLGSAVAWPLLEKLFKG